MKKHEKMELVQNTTASDMFKILKDPKIKKMSFKSISDTLIKEYKKYKIKEWSDEENETYFNQMIGHGERILKKAQFIEVEGKAKEKVYTKINFDAPKPFENIKSENIVWDTKQKISNIFEFVDSKKHFIPFFQRGTAWVKTNDYIELAYSIFKSVPLGIMYLWKIDKESIKKIKHNKFKRDITKDSSLSDFDIATTNEIKSKQIYSVIDGQQRVTGINVIINGTLDGKKLFFNEGFPGSKKFKFFDPGERIVWTSVESIYESLLKIKNQIDLLRNEDKKQLLKFDEEIKTSADQDEIDLIKERKTKKQLEQNSLIIKEKFSLLKVLSEEMFISEESLESFYNGFFEAELIAICELPDTELLGILELFIRTNKFGKKLNPTDIMLSYIVGQNMDVRNRVVKLHESAKELKPNIKLSTILKLVSVIFNDDASINSSDFFKINTSKIKEGFLDINKKESWDKIGKAFGQLKRITNDNFDIKWIKSENSIIPIIYWIIYKNSNKYISDDKVIGQINGYLLLAQLSRAFRSGTDHQLNFIIKNLKDDFSLWKIDLNKDETIKLLENTIASYRYKTNNPEIKILLMSIGAYFKFSDSIEHIQAQNNNGEDGLNNLTLLPKEINSELKDLSIAKKIKKLQDSYNMPREEVLEKLLLTEEEVEAKIFSPKRVKRILGKFREHLQ